MNNVHSRKGQLNLKFCRYSWQQEIYLTVCEECWLEARSALETVVSNDTKFIQSLSYSEQGCKLTTSIVICLQLAEFKCLLIKFQENLYLTCLWLSELFDSTCSIRDIQAHICGFVIFSVRKENKVKPLKFLQDVDVRI